MAAYTLKDMDDKFWSQVKAHAALKRVTIQNLIIKLIEKEIENNNNDRV